jgi:hypothetical protein
VVADVVDVDDEAALVLLQHRDDAGAVAAHILVVWGEGSGSARDKDARARPIWGQIETRFRPKWTKVKPK